MVAGSGIRKVGTGARTGRAVVRLAPTNRYAQFATGELTAADLDDEEILRGQLKDRNGKFGGRPPSVIPRAFLDAIAAERPKRLQALLDKEIPYAIRALHEVMVGGTSNKGGGAKVAAATKILEYAIGKPKESLDLRVGPAEADEPWRGVLPQIFHVIDVPDGEPEDLTMEPVSHANRTIKGHVTRKGDSDGDSADQAEPGQ